MSPGTNLVLIGMPGSGKSTVGLLAAQRLGWDFLDTDLLLQRRHGLSLAELLSRRGPAGFLAAEDDLICSLTVEQTVIATGGSVVLGSRGPAHLKTLGTVVWLDVPLAELEARLGDMAGRGVVLGPGQSLADVEQSRRPLYEAAASWRFEGRRESLERTAARLVDRVRPGSGSRPSSDPSSAGTRP